jgi:hypothetical protein
MIGGKTPGRSVSEWIWPLKKDLVTNKLRHSLEDAVVEVAMF